MNSASRHALKFVGTIVLVTFSACVALIVGLYLTQGHPTLGIIAVAEIATHIGIPVFVVLFFVVPSLFGVYIFLVTYRRAKRHGLTVSQFIDLRPEEKEKLR